MRKLLKKKRIEKGLTQQDIADKIGIHRTTYTNIELGKADPSFKVNIKIKEILDYYDDNIFFNSKVFKSHKNKIKNKKSNYKLHLNRKEILNGSTQTL